MDSVVLWVCVDCWYGVHGILEDASALARYRDAMGRVQRDNEPLGVSIRPDGACESAEFCAMGEHDCDSLNYCEESARCESGECDCNTVAFSWNNCELCLSSLGGSRHAVTLFVEF